MPSSSALLCCLVFLAGVAASRDASTLSDSSCIHLPTSLPHMLRELRAAFNRVKTFFQMKDQLHSLLLTQSLLDDFKGYLGCQALSEMIQFYLEEVMPKAENHGPDIKEHVNSLGEKLKTLRLRLRRCHRFLPCENKSKAVEKVKRVFSEVRLGCWQGGPEDRDLHPLLKGRRWAGAQQALNFARRECGNPASGVTSSSSEGPPPQLYLFSVKCLWGFLNDCSLPSQACRLGRPASCEHSERGAGESDRGNRK
uniref:Interleukin family protein n=1 Tax=Bos indicus x Bos taurus TaxID=30522 RepID=A0A4W2HJQ9_BOBOX